MSDSQKTNESPQKGEDSRQQAKFRPDSQVKLVSDRRSQRLPILTNICIVHEMKYLSEIPTMNIENPTLALFRHFSSLLTNLRSTNVENVRQITPFYAKQSQFYAFFARKRRFHEKINPIQTQLKPKQTQFNPIQTQFKANLTQ